MAGFQERYWLIIAAVLFISLVTGIIFLSVRMSQLQPVEISIRDRAQPAISGQIFIGGEVYRPGIYPVKPDDTLASCIEAAGVSEDADLSKIKIIIPTKNSITQPQKIDLNRAEAWLLQSLPGIAEGRARAIIEYREKNGPFRCVDDLLKVDGFGSTTLDKIRGYITVVD